MSELVYVIDESTGELRPNPIPRCWLDHPIHGAGIRLYGEPSPSIADEPAGDHKAPAAGESERGKN